MRDILEAIADAGHTTRAVCIGGINSSNVERVAFQCSPPRKPIDGVAVVSAIVAAPEPESEARKLFSLVQRAPNFRYTSLVGDASRFASPQDILAFVPQAIESVHKATPLSHNMTNLVSYSAEALSW